MPGDKMRKEGLAMNYEDFGGGGYAGSARCTGNIEESAKILKPCEERSAYMQKETYIM